MERRKLMYERPTTIRRSVMMENVVMAASLMDTRIMMSDTYNNVRVEDFTKDTAFGTEGMWSTSFDD